jgi:hypothetical protein
MEERHGLRSRSAARVVLVRSGREWRRRVRARFHADASKTDISRSGEAVKALGEILQCRSRNAHREPGRPVRAAVSPSHPRVACWAARDQRATGQERAVEEADYAPLYSFSWADAPPCAPRQVPSRAPSVAVPPRSRRGRAPPGAARRARGSAAAATARCRRRAAHPRRHSALARRCGGGSQYGWCRRERLCAGTRPGPGYSTTAVCGSGHR